MIIEKFPTQQGQQQLILFYFYSSTMGESGIFFSLRVYASYGLGGQVHDGLLERHDQAK